MTKRPIWPLWLIFGRPKIMQTWHRARFLTCQMSRPTTLLSPPTIPVSHHIIIGWSAWLSVRFWQLTSSPPRPPLATTQSVQLSLCHASNLATPMQIFFPQVPLRPIFFVSCLSFRCRVLTANSVSASILIRQVHHLLALSRFSASATLLHAA